MNKIEKEDMFLIEKAFECCKKLDFKSAYDALSICKGKYRINFFPIICLNLEKYKEGYEYRKILLDDKLPSITMGDDKFAKKCMVASDMCLYANEIEEELSGRMHGSCTVSVNVEDYLSILKSIKLYIDLKEYENARYLIVENLEMLFWNYEIWFQYATILMKELSVATFEDFVNPHMIKVFIPLKKAAELNKELDDLDYDLHFTLIQLIFALKSFGLEMPSLLATEFIKLKSSARNSSERINAEQLEENAKSIQKIHPFIDEKNRLYELKELFDCISNEPKINENCLTMMISDGLFGINRLFFTEKADSVKMDLIVPVQNVDEAKKFCDFFRFIEYESNTLVYSECQISVRKETPFFMCLSRTFSKSNFSSKRIYDIVIKMMETPKIVLQKLQKEAANIEASKDKTNVAEKIGLWMMIAGIIIALIMSLSDYGYI